MKTVKHLPDNYQAQTQGWAVACLLLAALSGFWFGYGLGRKSGAGEQFLQDRAACQRARLNPYEREVRR